ncbi:hypothetical protein [Haloplanus sp. C73]|uniref:hypothetical protein n=1 Tax=Haloplanus sp. C73 TaxID=3421641 RepID=UPI003EBC62F3
MTDIDLILSLLTATVTQTSLLLIIYTFFRRLQYDYKGREGIPNDTYQTWSKGIALATIAGLLATLSLLAGVTLADQLHINWQQPSLPATLTGTGILLFFVEVILLLLGFIYVSSEELN